MFRTTPRVESGCLYHSEASAETILVGTTVWYDWLERHDAFLFTDRVGGFTAHKRRTDPHNLGWEASYTRHGKHFRVHLGPSEELTLERLQAAVQALENLPSPIEPAEVDLAASTTSIYTVSQTAVPVGSPSSLIRTKLYQPRSGTDVISRTRLIERLHAALGGKATLVCAPAGFGKSTLVAEWVKALERQVAWLSLDDNDNELPIFVHSLVAALQSAVPDSCQAAASLRNATQFPSVASVATLLINDLADLSEDIVLVLDDYHLIHNSEVHRLLEMLVGHLPPQVHLVFVTRSDPPLPLVQWQAKGYLHELRGIDLRFTLQETEAFLAPILGSEQVHQTAFALEECTGGWIAVLRLAALSLRNTADRVAFLERLGHFPDRTISDYLVEEILTRQSPAVQELLMRASMLDTFCAELCTELCAEVLGSAIATEEVQATLDWLERSNLFLVSLADSPKWYRLHPLFQGLLRQRLRKHASAEKLAALHRRASAWYGAQGLIDEALRHALAAGDVSGAAHLLEAQFLWAFEQEQVVQMERWLRLVPQEQIQGNPSLLIAQAWILQARGQITDFPRLLTTAERLVGTDESSAHDAADRHSRILHALIALGWSHFHYLSGQGQASLQSAQAALHWLPPGEAHLSSQAMQYLAWSKQAIGQQDVALAVLHQALRDLPARPTITPHLLFAQALVFLPAGKLPQVEYTARHLLHLAQEADLAVAQAWAHALLGIVYYEWDRLEEAAYHFSLVIANRHHAHFLAVRDAMCGLALAYHAQGLDKEAQATTDALLAWLQDQQYLQELQTAYAFCGRLALLGGEGESAAHWLELAGEPAALGPMLCLEEPGITRAWLLVARGDAASVAEGQALLTTLLEHVEAIHSTRKAIQVLALQAWAYDLQGQAVHALEVLDRALALGRPTGFLRTFADLPPLATLLQELRKRRKSQQVLDSTPDAYLHRILGAMHLTPAHPTSTEALLQEEGLEPLTGRELHILRLLDKDLSNKEIARELVVTPGTVKVHTNNLYRKLSVKNRRAAVSLAKALGILARDQGAETAPGGSTSRTR